MNNVFELAFECLTANDIAQKVSMTNTATEIIKSGQAEFKPYKIVCENIKPGRPESPELINAKDVARRNTCSTEGKAAMIHSIAHIEFNAINLAWDLICRFQHMPKEFYLDWAQVAEEEAKHFGLLREKLICMGYDYGSFSAHDGLWTIAEKTKHDISLRLAVVPRIMEARGLDVTPDIIERFKQAKDDEMVSILELILEEEIGHVMFGTKWYRYVCQESKEDPEEKFKLIMNEYLPSTKTKKINQNARMKAGFSQTEIDCLTEVQ